MKEIHAIADRLARPDFSSAVLATLVDVQGSSYRRPGARLLIEANQRLGSISGGCLEADVLARGAEVAASGEPQLAIYDTTSENDLVWGVGLGCHGIARVLLERIPATPAWARALCDARRQRRTVWLAVSYDLAGAHEPGTSLGVAGTSSEPGRFIDVIKPPTRLAIFGAGDDAMPLARLAAELGWDVIVADPRSAFATRDRFPMAGRVLHGAPATLPVLADLDGDSVAVVMTHHYVHDVPLLQALVDSPAAYIGLLGPRKRAEKILADLAADGTAINASVRQRLHAPVGLDIGADGAEQVALSIVAEIQAFLNGRSGRSLRERKLPIHAYDPVQAAATQP